MKSLVSLRPGGPETLQIMDFPAPQPGPNEVRVAVEACGVNYPDVLIIQDLYQFRPQRPFAPGAEVAGRVDAVGEAVGAFKIGDRVAGGLIYGGMSEQVILPESKCFAIPDSMPAVEASAFLMTYGTSQHALKDRAKIQTGETLFVLGAAGGVGLAAVELGKAYGARVIAGVSSAAKAEAAKAHGADAVIVYPSGEFGRDAAKALTDSIKSISGGDGVDVIYDSVGGPYAEPALRAAAWEGRYLVVGFPAGIPKLPTNLTLLKGCSIVGVFWGAFVERAPEQHRENVAALLRMYEAGQIRPLVSEHFPLARGGEAITRLASRAAIGKIVVTMP